MRTYTGTAGWSIPKQHKEQFEDDAGSGLCRYGKVFGCAEINSTFYRSHRLSTYQRWASEVPEAFRFSVKAPKTITHECGLAPAAQQFREFLEEVRHLGSKLGPVLFQLPPRQGFVADVARRFLDAFREEYPVGEAALEPRHAEWFGEEADALLRAYRVARVAADPARVPEAARPGGDLSLVYYRLHGAPRMYYSSYSPESLETLGAEMVQQRKASQAWCIFDNTASGAALGNALELMQRLGAR